MNSDDTQSNPVIVMLKCPFTRRNLSQFLRWGGACISLGLVILYVLSVPFYSGSALPLKCAWRLEHGCLKFERKSAGTTESFYIAINSEGLRFLPECRVFNSPDWMVNIPLWIPLLAIGGWTTRAWISHHRNTPRFKTGCPGCGYNRDGLLATKCPECGSDQTAQ